MTTIQYFQPMFERLTARTEWRGPPLANTDVLTLEDAARFASKHAGEEVTPGDFLRAAGRGQITLMAIVHRAGKVQKFDGGVYCNGGAANENIVAAGSSPTLPLTACQHLAAAGCASWRTFDSFDNVDGDLMRYTKGWLIEGEPDFETVPADCRVTGNDIHALADAFKDEPQPQAAPESAGDAPLSMAKAALISAHEHEWPTIARDIADATSNGLADAAKAGSRGWGEKRAIEWARAKGKLKSADRPVDSLAQGVHSMFNLPGRKHTL